MHVIWNLLRAELSSHATMLRSFVVVAAIISTANLVMGGATPAIAVCNYQIGRASCRERV